MDKSFNDQELSDIMKEIEALEEDFSSEAGQENETRPQASHDADSLAHAAADAEEVEAFAEVDAVIQELAELEAEEAVQVRTLRESPVVSMKEEKPAPVAPKQYHKPAVSKGHTAMSFRVQGDLALDLQFEIGDQVVSLEVSETGLTVQMDNGVHFTVPLKSKKAA